MQTTETEPTQQSTGTEDTGATPTRSQEWQLFLFIIVLLFPLLSVALVGGYGFSIWMYQLLAGPPTVG